jgi:hypothetical protein
MQNICVWGATGEFTCGKAALQPEGAPQVGGGRERFQSAAGGGSAEQGSVLSQVMRALNVPTARRTDRGGKQENFCGCAGAPTSSF